MNQRNTKTTLVSMCLLSVCYTLASCASPSPTDQFLISPAIAPAGTAKIVFSRSSGPGWMTNLFVLSSPRAVGQASQGKPTEPVVEYCHVTGKTPGNYVLVPDVDARCKILDWSRLDRGERSIDLLMRCAAGSRTLLLAVTDFSKTRALAPELSRSCVGGAEIGTVASGGQLQWLVEEGPLTVTIYPWLLSATLQVEAGRAYRLHFEYAKNSISVETQQ